MELWCRWGGPPTWANWWISFGSMEWHASRVGIWCHRRLDNGDTRTLDIVFWPPRIQGHTMSKACQELLARNDDWNSDDFRAEMAKVEPVYWMFPRYPKEWFFPSLRVRRDNRTLIAWAIMLGVTVTAAGLCWALFNLAIEIMAGRPHISHRGL